VHHGQDSRKGLASVEIARSGRSVDEHAPVNENSILAFMLVRFRCLGWIVWSFAGAILWAVLLSIIFSPWYQLLLARIPRWRNTASSATVLLIAILVVFPLTLVASALLQEVSGLVERFQSGELDLQRSLLEFRSPGTGGAVAHPVRVDGPPRSGEVVHSRRVGSRRAPCSQLRP
jgi:predicted PurR-regulated permease PerM